MTITVSSWVSRESFDRACNVAPTTTFTSVKLSLSQPLRVVRPGAPYAFRRPHDGGRGDPQHLGLGCGARRQAGLGLRWQQPLALGELRVGATLSHDPGHRENAEPELVVLSGWQHRS